MTLERILKKKLKTFLNEGFPGSIVSNNLKLGLILPLMVKIVQDPFRIHVFTMTTQVAPEDILYLSEQYYFERNWLKKSEKIVDIRHNGMDLSFERDGERLFVILSPFKTFVQITTVKLKKTNNKKDERKDTRFLAWFLVYIPSSKLYCIWTWWTRRPYDFSLAALV
jgi:hypothetical protein